MRKFIVKHLVVSVVVLSFACGDAKKDEIKTLQDEVIGIHDEVMPKMGELQKLKFLMNNLGDSMVLIGSADSALYYNKSKTLDSANNLMMDWMHKYNLDLTSYTKDEAVEYLKKEKEKMLTVKDVMNAAILSAKQSGVNH